MRHARLQTALIAAALSLAICFGSLGCLITGFRLNPVWPGRLAAIWIAAALICPPMLSRRHGPEILLCLAALALGYLLRQGDAVRGLKALICALADTFDRAYGWGAIYFPGHSGGYPDYPLGIWGCLLTAAVCRSVCRRRSPLPPVLLSLALPGLCALVPGAAPHRWALFALLGAGAVLLLTGGVRRESAAQANRLTGMVLLPVAVCLGLLFLLNPIENYVNRSEAVRERLSALGITLAEKWALPAGILPAALPELPGAVDLAALDGRARTRVPVLSVTAEKSGPLYLRGRDYDRYTGTGWESGESRQESFGGWGEPEERVHISTFSLQDVLYLPYYPAGDTVLEDGRLSNSEALLAYTASRYPMGSAAPPEALEACLSLPEETAQWASALVPPGESTQEKAAAIAALVRQSARYDKATGKMPPEERDFARWFLEQSETGYCVHFATAAAVLLRAAGIPARYVTGYRVEALAEQAVTVTTLEAHAWAEYYDASQGCWLVLEATPPARSGTEATAPEMEPATPTGAESPDVDATGGKAPRSSLRMALPALLNTLILLAALAPLPVLRRHFRLWLRRRRKARAGINERALLWWREAEGLSARLNKPVPEELKALAEKARYSQHRLTPLDLTPLTDYCRQCREALEKQDRFARLVNRYVFVLY